MVKDWKVSVEVVERSRGGGSSGEAERRGSARLKPLDHALGSRKYLVGEDRTIYRSLR